MLVPSRVSESLFPVERGPFQRNCEGDLHLHQKGRLQPQERGVRTNFWLAW